LYTQSIAKQTLSIGKEKKISWVENKEKKKDYNKKIIPRNLSRLDQPIVMIYPPTPWQQPRDTMQTISDRIYDGLAILLQTIEAKENDTESPQVDPATGTRKRKDSFDRSKEEFVASLLECGNPQELDRPRQPKVQLPYNEFLYAPYPEDEEDFYADNEETSSETEDFEPVAKRKKVEKKTDSKPVGKKKGRGRPTEPYNINQCQLCGDTSTNTQYIGSTLRNTRRCRSCYNKTYREKVLQTRKGKWY